MRTACGIVLVLLAACTADPPPAPDSGPDPWTGEYRYDGTRTWLAREGKFFRFSDAKLSRFYFRVIPGGWLEDDTPCEPVRVFPDARSARDGTPYRSLRFVFEDDDFLLIRQ